MGNTSALSALGAPLITIIGEVTTVDVRSLSFVHLTVAYRLVPWGRSGKVAEPWLFMAEL